MQQQKMHSQRSGLDGRPGTVGEEDGGGEETTTNRIFATGEYVVGFQINRICWKVDRRLLQIK
jgi:hypothetical protein